LQQHALLLSFEIGARIAGSIDRLGRVCVDKGRLALRAAPQQVAAHVDGDPKKPRLERPAGIHPMQILERAKEHFLRRVRRVVSIAQQSHRQRHDSALVADDDLLERRLVAAEGQADEARDFRGIRRQRLVRHP